MWMQINIKWSFTADLPTWIRSGSWKSLSNSVALILIVVLLYFSPLKLYTWKWKASSRDLVWITYEMASLEATSTGSLIATISDTWLTAISRLSRAQPGRLSCPGTEHRKIFLIFEARHFCRTHQSTTRLRTGTLTARLWLEWRFFAANQSTGEQPAALTKCNKRLITEITSEASSATLTSWRMLVRVNVSR